MKKIYKNKNKYKTKPLMPKNENSLPSCNKNIIVYVNSISSIKLMGIVLKYKTEVSWHGTVKKIDEDKYLITDILIHPQLVTLATVRCEDDKYAEWRNNLSDDVYNTLRMYGHSHNTMSATPSIQDIETDMITANMLQNNQYYIQMILNKDLQYSLKIYEKIDNVLYCTDGKLLFIIDNNNTFEDFHKENEHNIQQNHYYSKPIALNKVIEPICIDEYSYYYWLDDIWEDKDEFSKKQRVF